MMMIIIRTLSSAYDPLFFIISKSNKMMKVMRILVWMFCRKRNHFSQKKEFPAHFNPWINGLFCCSSFFPIFISFCDAKMCTKKKTIPTMKERDTKTTKGWKQHKKTLLFIHFHSPFLAIPFLIHSRISLSSHPYITCYIVLPLVSWIATRFMGNKATFCCSSVQIKGDNIEKSHRVNIFHHHKVHLFIHFYSHLDYNFHFSYPFPYHV